MNNDATIRRYSKNRTVCTRSGVRPVTPEPTIYPTVLRKQRTIRRDLFELNHDWKRGSFV